MNKPIKPIDEVNMGKRVRHIQELENLTCEQMAKMLNVSCTQYKYNLLTGNNKFTSDKQMFIMKYFKVRAEYLLYGDESKGIYETSEYDSDTEITYQMAYDIMKTKIKEMNDEEAMAALSDAMAFFSETLAKRSKKR